MAITYLDDKPSNINYLDNEPVELTGTQQPDEEGKYYLSTEDDRKNWSALGPIGWWEYASRTKGNDIYYGDLLEASQIYGIAMRLQDNEYGTEQARMEDMGKLKDFMLEQEEMQTRGMSYGANVYKVVANIPSFAAEFALTGGIASATRKAATAIAGKVIKETAKKGLIKKGAEVLAREAVVAAVRTSVLPHRYMAGYAERRVNDVISITDKGIELIENADEQPVVSFMKAYADAFVEYYSETMGGELFKPAAGVVGKGIVARMPDATRKTFIATAEAIKKNIPKGRIVDLITRGGFDGILEEYGEERFGALMRVAIGLDEREMTTLDKLQNAVFPGWEQSMIEIGAFSIWGGASASAQGIANYMRGRGKSQKDIDTTLRNLSAKEKDEFVEKIGGDTFDEASVRAKTIVKAAAGADLTSEEQAKLDEVYDDFVRKGLIEKRVEELKDVPVFVSTEDALDFGNKVKEDQKMIDKLHSLRDSTLLEVADLKKNATTKEQKQKTMDKIVEAQFYREALEAAGVPEGDITKSAADAQAKQIVSANVREIEDKSLKEKAKIIYQGREKQLDQERISIEKEMTLLEQQMKERKEQGKPTKEIQNKLNKLSKNLESVHFQIADLEDYGIKQLEKEGIKIKGSQLERLRSLSFKTGQVAMRAEMLKKARETRAEREKKAKDIKTVLQQPKKPENVVDIKFQRKIEEKLEKLGPTKQDRKKSLNKMSPEELAKLAIEIGDLKAEGRQSLKEKKKQKQLAADILRASLIKAAGGMPDGTLTKGSREEKKAKRAGFLTQADLSTISPLNLIRRVFGKVGERLLYDSIDAADTIKNANINVRKSDIEKASKKHNVNIFDLGKIIEIDGRSFQINDILRMYLATKDRQSMEALLFGNNITESEVNNFIQEVDAKYLKFADAVQKIVAKKYNEIADTMAEFYNVKVEKVKTYFPLRRIAFGLSQEEINDSLETELVQEQVLRKGSGFTYTTVDKGNTISRKEIDAQFQTEISLDFFGDAMRIIDKQEHLISYAPLQKTFNQILNDGDLQNAVKYNHSESAWRQINDYLVNNLNPDTMYENGNGIVRFANQYLKKVRVGLSKAFLMFNVVTAGKQFPSAYLALKYTDNAQLARSIMNVTRSKKYRETIYDIDPALRNRVISRDFNDLMTDIQRLPDGDIKRKLVQLSTMVDKAGFTMIMNMDKFAVLAVVDSVYNTQRKTKSDAESRDIAHKAYIETQPQGSTKDLPALYRTNNEAIRMMIMFTNQLNKIWNMIRVDLPNEIAEKHYSTAMKGISSIMVSSTLIYIASHGRLPEDWDDFIDAIFGSSISSIPIVGNIGMSLVRGYDPSISPADTLIKTIQKVYSNISDGDYMNALEESMLLAAVATQMPYSMPKRLISGIYDLATEYTDDVRRLIWSEYMLENN